MSIRRKLPTRHTTLIGLWSIRVLAEGVPS